MGHQLPDGPEGAFVVVLFVKFLPGHIIIITIPDVSMKCARMKYHRYFLPNCYMLVRAGLNLKVNFSLIQLYDTNACLLCKISNMQDIIVGQMKVCSMPKVLDAVVTFIQSHWQVHLLSPIIHTSGGTITTFRGNNTN